MTTHVVTFTAPINSSTCGQLIRKCSEALNAEPTELILKIATMGGECSYGLTHAASSGTGGGETCCGYRRCGAPRPGK